MLCFVAILLTVLAIYSSVSQFEARAEMFADCTFEMTNVISDQRMATTFISKLASYQNLSHSCVVKTHDRNHFLRVKAKRNKKAKGKSEILKVLYAKCRCGRRMHSLYKSTEIKRQRLFLLPLPSLIPLFGLSCLWSSFLLCLRICAHYLSVNLIY